MTKRKPSAETERRASDEMVLAWLHYRLNGWTCQSIADLYGKRRSVVAAATADVRRADETESGEDVAGWYA